VLSLQVRLTLLVFQCLWKVYRVHTVQLTSPSTLLTDIHQAVPTTLFISNRENILGHEKPTAVINWGFIKKKKKRVLTVGRNDLL